ncbi:alpha/beta fold hydrolase [Devosia sp. Root685]|uniref:alpha/beta fold hydrolase n=1 Tax=Devosia sp. Root685 TaxID=1736587 RepID=UPI000B04DB1F|nr:alpha/beta hydrolase [Devosia sp. Root685]
MPQVVSKDGVIIGYDVTGSGPAVILVAGATQYRAVDRTGTPALIGLLAQHFTVVNFDRRGRGESTDKWPYAVAREVEDIAALLEIAGGEAFVFGVSSGAVLALEAASAMPRKIKGLVLYEPPIDPDRSGDAYRYEHMQMAMEAAQGRAAEMMSDFLLAVGMSREALQAFKESPAWPAYAAVGMTLEHDYRILADARAGDTPPEHWQNAIMPVLVLDGDKSFPFMAAGADWVASGLHNVERMTLAGQSHEYDPKLLAPLLTVFFQLGSVQVH